MRHPAFTDGLLSPGGGLTFFVAGTPAPKGSFRIATTNGVTMRGRPKLAVRKDTPATQAWEDAVGWRGKEVMRGRDLFDGPVFATVVFVLPRALRGGRPDRNGHTAAYTRELPDVKPDIDKLARSTLDGLAGICLADDARVVGLLTGKIFPARDRFQDVGAWIRLAEVLGHDDLVARLLP